MKKCVIIDYGLCNLLSVSNAFKYLGVDAEIISSPEKLKEADCAVLPGVGAFADGMKGLNKNGLIEPIRAYVDAGRPLLGICLGMELFMSVSYEFGEHQGLNLIPGQVLPFQTREVNHQYTVKVPHIGWSSLTKGSLSWEHTLLADLPEHSEMYFVHSFYVKPDYEENILAVTKYAENSFCSVVVKDNICGCQFHPEKSSSLGLKILKNFIKLSQPKEVTSVR